MTSEMSSDSEPYIPVKCRSPYPGYVPKQLDLNRVVKCMFDNLKTCRGDSVMYDMMRALYICRPEIFIPVGDVHTNEEGTRTYFTLRIYNTNDNYIRVHVYGSLRHNFFEIKSLDVMHFDRRYICEFRAKEVEKPEEKLSLW